MHTITLLLRETQMILQQRFEKKNEIAASVKP